MSLFNQLMVGPVAIVSGFAPYALVVNVEAPLEIVTVVLPAGGVGEGLDGELLHAARKMSGMRVAAKRRDMMCRSS